MAADGSSAAEKPCQCNVCSKRFAFSSNLARHARMHSHQSTRAEGRSNGQSMTTARRRSSRLDGAKPVSYHDASGSDNTECDGQEEEEAEHEGVNGGAGGGAGANEKIFTCNICNKGAET